MSQHPALAPSGKALQTKLKITFTWSRYLPHIFLLSSCHHTPSLSYFSTKLVILLPSQCVPFNVKFRPVPYPHPCSLSSALASSFWPSVLLPPLTPLPLLLRSLQLSLIKKIQENLLHVFFPLCYSRISGILILEKICLPIFMRFIN